MESTYPKLACRLNSFRAATRSAFWFADTCEPTTQLHSEQRIKNIFRSDSSFIMIDNAYPFVKTTSICSGCALAASLLIPLSLLLCYFEESCFAEAWFYLFVTVIFGSLLSFSLSVYAYRRSLAAFKLAFSDSSTWRSVWPLTLMGCEQPERNSVALIYWIVSYSRLELKSHTLMPFRWTSSINMALRWFKYGLMPSVPIKSRFSHWVIKASYSFYLLFL